MNRPIRKLYCGPKMLSKLDRRRRAVVDGEVVADAGCDTLILVRPHDSRLNPQEKYHSASVKKRMIGPWGLSQPHAPKSDMAARSAISSVGRASSVKVLDAWQLRSAAGREREYRRDQGKTERLRHASTKTLPDKPTWTNPNQATWAISQVFIDAGPAPA